MTNDIIFAKYNLILLLQVDLCLISLQNLHYLFVTKKLSWTMETPPSLKNFYCEAKWSLDRSVSWIHQYSWQKIKVYSRKLGEKPKYMLLGFHFFERNLGGREMNLVNEELLCASRSKGKHQKLIQGFRSVKAIKTFYSKYFERYPDSCGRLENWAPTWKGGCVARTAGKPCCTRRPEQNKLTK